MAAFVATKSLSHVHFARNSGFRTPSLRRKYVSVRASALNLCSPALSLKSRLADGDTLHGMAVLTLSPTLAEIAGLTGYDYAIIDLEHGEGGLPEALACLRALDATRTPAIIRIPEVCPIWAMKVLDLGPAGIMFPNIESPAMAAAAVSYCRYPPRGVRGAAHPIVRASGYGLDDSYVSCCEDKTLIICQVETPNGIAELEAITAVEGVDVVHMGPYDLAANMGCLHDPENEKVRAKLREAERKVLEASRSNMVYLAGSAMANDPPEQLKLRGYHMVLGAKDIVLFRKAALETVKRFKEEAMQVGEVKGKEYDGHKYVHM